MLTIENTCNDYIKTCGFPLKTRRLIKKKWHVFLQ